jgi:transcriptional regulator with XRE-family HTH domain
MHAANNRIRRARRSAGLTQVELATRVGVHRSAVAQWEASLGSHPTAEHSARIALATAVSFEWLMTGRGRMRFDSDIIPGDATPAVLLTHCAQDEVEVRALAVMRKLDTSTQLAVIELMDALTHPRPLKLNRRTAYSR